MQQMLRFHPDIVEWWLDLRALAGRLGRVEVWRSLDHPPAAGDGLGQHPTVTLVACLRGAVRVLGGRGDLDLAPGDVLLIQAGAWHGHPALRPGAVAFMQGFIAGRSDYHLASDRVLGMASIPAQPYRGLLDQASRSGEAGRRRLVADALASVVRERTEPLAAPHPALLDMEHEMYVTLHLRNAITRVVRASGLGRAQAYRLARAHWGQGLAALRRQLRLALARELAVDGVPESEIARRCGFSGAAFRRARKVADA